MAIDARNSALQVSGAAIVVLLVAALVAIQATSTDIRGRRVLECEDFCLVPAALDVFFARAVASLAAMPRRAFLAIESRYEMGGCFVTRKKPL